MKKLFFILLVLSIACFAMGQSISKSMLKLPDTGETTKYTTTFGEDADYLINAPFLKKNTDGTVLDTITGLMWQQTDGGEMTIENARFYPKSLTLGGYSDWRLPTAHESFSILNHQKINPALDITVFTSTAADYWWTSDKQTSDSTKIWCTNAGGGVGNHPKSETVSAGGTKKFHVRVVRNTKTPTTVANQFTDNGNSTNKDNLTGLTWQQVPNSDSLTWENALAYAENLVLAGYSDWRLPNIKELQSINDERLVSPSVSPAFFKTIGVKNYWSSTTLPNQTTRAWYLSTQFGITTYELKTARLAVICVRGNGSSATTASKEINGEANFVKVFPNPITNKEIRFEILDNAENITARVCDLQGRILFEKKYEKQLLSHPISITLPSLTQGVYFLQIERSGLMNNHKFFVID